MSSFVPATFSTFSSNLGLETLSVCTLTASAPAPASGPAKWPTNTSRRKLQPTW